jgi:hypothetical protein
MPELKVTILQKCRYAAQIFFKYLYALNILMQLFCPIFIK